MLDSGEKSVAREVVLDSWELEGGNVAESGEWEVVLGSWELEGGVTPESGAGEVVRGLGGSVVLESGSSDVRILDSGGGGVLKSGRGVVEKPGGGVILDCGNGAVKKSGGREAKASGMELTIGSGDVCFEVPGEPVTVSRVSAGEASRKLVATIALVSAGVLCLEDFVRLADLCDLEDEAGALLRVVGTNVEDAESVAGVASLGLNRICLGGRGECRSLGRSGGGISLEDIERPGSLMVTFVREAETDELAVGVGAGEEVDAALWLGIFGGM